MKEQLRTVPSHIRQYGSQGNALPDLLFNYLGQLGGAEKSNSKVGFDLDMGKEVGQVHSTENHSTTRLALNGYVYDGSLKMEWGFDQVEYEYANVDRFAQEWVTALERVVAVGSNPALQQWTPSDFPLCNLPTDAFKSVIAQVPEGHQVVSMARLTSLQSGVVAGTIGTPTAYVVQSVRRVHGLLDLDRLRRSWEVVAKAHDVLRTRILIKGLPHPVQVVLEGAGPFVGWKQVDTSEDPRNATTCALEIALAEREKSFNFELEPLLRLTLVKRADGVVHVIQTSHHSILDGWSDAILRQDLMIAYKGGSVSTSPPFFNVVERLLHPDHHSQKQFWSKQLQGFQSANKLLLTPPAEVQTQSECSQQTGLSAEVARAAAAAMHVTVASVVNAAWALVMRCLSGDSGVVFGVVTSGRSTGGDAEATVGLMINTLPMHVQVPLTTPAAAWLKDIQTQYAEMISHESTSLGDIQKWTGIYPLLETSVDFVNYPKQDNSPDDNPFELSVVDLSEKTDLLLSLDVVVNDTVELHLMYDEGRVSSADAETALKATQRAIEWLLDAGHCNVPMSAAVQHVWGVQYMLVLERWNDSAVAYDAQDSSVQMFERWAETTPENVALTFGGEAVTYAALYARSSTLALQLQHHGAASESVVGFMCRKALRRCWEWWESCVRRQHTCLSIPICQCNGLNFWCRNASAMLLSLKKHTLVH